MSVSAIQGPGILFVRSRISPASENILDEPTFLRWYDDEHIPEVVSTSGIRSASRYIDVNKTSPTGDVQNLKPFLTFYPMQNLDFTLSDEFKKISVQSSILPDSGIIYDFADMDVSYLGFLGATPRKDGDVGGHAKYILSSGIRPEKEPGIDGIQTFFHQQTSILSQSPHFIRTLRYKLLYARTNAQSRALKGLPTTDEPHPEPSTWLAIHEFSAFPDRIREEISTEAGAEWGRTESEVHVWKLDRMHVGEMTAEVMYTQRLAQSN
ncbi:hypothetical protein PTTW11_03650 [Pyrenophora teres f. teres]|uniref:EthD domain-containing protein n=1 Tax=Pyrenophora teres f. teres TaxID=97479 RepID=A0A6S6VM85_9PLEO|nr:hypothetical protein PTTW11_03650 [Pyrenophora teres f. teres]